MPVDDSRRRLAYTSWPAKLLIHSETLMELIRGMVHYYPGQNLLGDSVEIKEPQAILMYHWDDLLNEAFHLQFGAWRGRSSPSGRPYALSPTILPITHCACGGDACRQVTCHQR